VTNILHPELFTAGNPVTYANKTSQTRSDDSEKTLTFCTRMQHLTPVKELKKSAGNVASERGVTLCEGS
jgi:hypothetical protein